MNSGNLTSAWKSITVAVDRLRATRGWREFGVETEERRCCWAR